MKKNQDMNNIGEIWREDGWEYEKHSCNMKKKSWKIMKNTARSNSKIAKLITDKLTVVCSSNLAVEILFRPDNGKFAYDMARTYQIRIHTKHHRKSFNYKRTDKHRRTLQNSWNRCQLFVHERIIVAVVTLCALDMNAQNMLCACRYFASCVFLSWSPHSAHTFFFSRLLLLFLLFSAHSQIQAMIYSKCSCLLLMSFTYKSHGWNVIYLLCTGLLLFTFFTPVSLLRVSVSQSLRTVRFVSFRLPIQYR